MSLHPTRGRRRSPQHPHPIASVVAVFAMAMTAGAAAVPSASAHPVRPPDAQRSATLPPAAAPSTGPAQITGPIPATARPGDPSHDYVFYSTPYDLKQAGYEEQEFFIEGTATRYNANPATTSSGTAGPGSARLSSASA
jgi:hypothetical protein